MYSHARLILCCLMVRKEFDRGACAQGCFRSGSELKQGCFRSPLGCTFRRLGVGGGALGLECGRGDDEYFSADLAGNLSRGKNSAHHRGTRVAGFGR